MKQQSAAKQTVTLKPATTSEEGAQVSQEPTMLIDDSLPIDITMASLSSTTPKSIPFINLINAFSQVSDILESAQSRYKFKLNAYDQARFLLKHPNTFI